MSAGPPRPAARTRADLAWFALVCAVAFAVFLPTLANGFVNFDDDRYVTGNRDVRRGLTWRGVRWAFSEFHAANWHPLTWLGHMLDVELFGLAPMGHHLVQVGWHALAAGLIFLLLRQVARARSAALGALLFAVHPLRVESVAWISERKDLMAATFFLSACLAWFHYARRPGLARYALVVVAFACGLLSKPMVVTLPAVLLLLDVWPLGRWRWCSGERAGRSLALLVAEKLPLLLLSLGSAWITVAAQSANGSVQAADALPLLARVDNAALSIVIYLRQTLWPARLAVFYPHPSMVGGADAAASLRATGTAALILVAVLTVLVLVALRKRPWLACSWGWILVTLSPVLGFVQVGQQAHADRYTYLPMIGLLWPLVLGFDAAFRRVPRAAAWIAALVLVALGWRTTRQIHTWRSSETLWRAALAVTENNYLAHHMLGVALAEQGRWDEARAEVEQALQINPDHTFALTTLAAIDAAAAGAQRGEQGWLELLRRTPGDATARLRLGRLYLASGRAADALRELRRAHHDAPESVEVRLGLGDALLANGLAQEAHDIFQALVSKRPKHVGARKGLARADAALGKPEEALAGFERVLLRRPGDTATRLAAARACLVLGREGRAREHLLEVLARAPDQPEAAALMRRMGAER